MSETFILHGNTSIARGLARRFSAAIRRELGKRYSLTSFAPGEAGVPGNRTRWWVSGPNLGHPFDRDASRTVEAIADRLGVQR